MNSQSPNISSRPVRAAIVGAGPRSGVYTEFARRFPAELTIASIVDPDPARRAAMADAFGVPAAMRLDSYESLGRLRDHVDAAFVCTPDIYHYPACMNLLRDGFDVLLEKPIAPIESEVRGIIDAASASGRVVMVAHILRYEPFFQQLRDLLRGGAIGRLISIQNVENVGFEHIATTFTRHPRNLLPAPMPMLLSKCCHDLDIIAWLVGDDAKLKSVSSAIKPSQFRPENAPAGSTQRCLGGCQVEPTCVYSAKAIYVDDDNTWGTYAWYGYDPATLTRERKLQLLADTNPYGQCVWHCKNNAVDHQGVLVQFENGMTATHDLFCAAPEAGRSIRIFGTGGEIIGSFVTGEIIVRTSDRSRPGHSIRHVAREGHPPASSKGAKFSDLQLVHDFIATVRGEPAAQGLSRIQHSLNGHLIAFAADQSAREARTITF